MNNEQETEAREIIERVAKSDELMHVERDSRAYLDKYHKPDPDAELRDEWGNFLKEYNGSSEAESKEAYEYVKGILATQEHDNQVRVEVLDEVAKYCIHSNFIPAFTKICDKYKGE